MNAESQDSEAKQKSPGLGKGKGNNRRQDSLCTAKCCQNKVLPGTCSKMMVLRVDGVESQWYPVENFTPAITS